MKKNKYEDMEILDLEDKVDDILSIFADRLIDTDKTVGIIVNKETAEYIVHDLLYYGDDISAKEINFVDYLDIDEYVVYVDDDGYLTAIPIADELDMTDVDIVYIDMDGSIKQNIIDYCVNEDKEVILFGQKDDDCDGDCEHCYCMSDTGDTYVHLSDGDDGNTHGFTASKSDGDSYMSYSYYTSEELSQNDIERILKAFGF